MKHSLPLFFGLLTCAAATAQTLPEPPTTSVFRYSPERPKIDGVVSFTYTPTGPLTRETAVQAVFLRYGSPAQMRLSQPETVTTVRQGDAFVGTIKIPFKEVAGLLVAFQSRSNPSLVDHNNTHFYPVVVYNDRTGALLPHASGGQGSVMMRTSFPYTLKIKPDWAWVIQRYEREIEQFPTTRPLYWADLIRARMQQAEPGYQQTCLAEVTTYLTTYQATLTPADLKTAAQFYDQLGEPKLAQQARGRMKSADHNSAEAQTARMDAMRAEPDLEKKRAEFDKFVATLPKSPYRGVAVSIIADAYFKAGKLRELVEFMGAEGVRETDPAQLLAFAQQLASEGRGWPQAEWLANRAIWAFTTKTAPNAVAARSAAGRPGRSRKRERATQAATDASAPIRAAKTVLAQAADQQGHALTALNAYRDVLSNVPIRQTDPRINERIWLCARQVSRADSVFPFVLSVLKANRSTPGLRTSVRDWHTARLAGTRELASYQRDISVIEQADRRADMLAQLINEPAAPFTLMTLDGGRVSLAKLAGNVVVVDFWATSCEPCVATFPAKRQVRDLFRNDPNVQFLFVNTNEARPLQQVRRFVAKQPYLGAVPLDPTQKMADAYGVKLFPANVVIDPKGRIRYRNVGYSGNPAATADELRLVIEALRE